MCMSRCKGRDTIFDLKVLYFLLLYFLYILSLYLPISAQNKKGAVYIMYNRGFLFNGIGSKPEKLLAQLTPEMMDRYEAYRTEAFARLGLELDMSKNTGYSAKAAEWMIPFLCDRVVYEYLIGKGIVPDIGAGYSSGIVSASACFGSIRHEDAHDIVMTHLSMFRRLQEKGIKLDMGIIIGFHYDELKEIFKGKFSSDELVIGSGNSSFHVMISGRAEAVEKAIALCLEEGAIKAFKMNTGTAFHHPLMEQYSSEYISLCNKLEYKEPEYPIISVFDHTVIKTVDEIRKENLLNVFTPMRWDLALKKMEELGVKEFFDISANGAINKFSRVSRRCRVYTLEDVVGGGYTV